MTASQLAKAAIPMSKRGAHRSAMAQGWTPSLMKKIASIIILVLVAAVAVGLGDWYRFVKYAELDPKRGVYGNDHLEVFIEINSRLPRFMREWGCKELITREAAVMGVSYDQLLSRAPLGCNPQRDSRPFDEVFFAGFAANAEFEAKRKNASPAQIEALKACVIDGVKASLSPTQMEAIKTGQDMEALTAASAAGQKVTVECLAKSGL
jgi:hypothetical protein